MTKLSKIIKGYLIAIVSSIIFLACETFAMRKDGTTVESWKDTVDAVASEPWYKQICIWTTFIIKLPITLLVAYGEALINKLSK